MLTTEEVMGVVERWATECSDVVDLRGFALAALEARLREAGDGSAGVRLLGDLSAKVGSLDGEVASLGRRLDYFINEVSETARD